jgi:hypothetical protein
MNALPPLFPVASSVPTNTLFSCQRQKSTMLAVISGAFQLGFIVFMLVKAAWESFGIVDDSRPLIDVPHSFIHVNIFDQLIGWTLQSMLWGYTALLVVLLFVGLWLWPDEPMGPHSFIGRTYPS